MAEPRNELVLAALWILTQAAMVTYTTPRRPVPDDRRDRVAARITTIHDRVGSATLLAILLMCEWIFVVGCLGG